MNLALYRSGIKGSWKLWLIFLAVMSMYITVVISMFDPELGSVMEELTAAMPELMALFGMQDMGSTLVEFMASYLYGMIFLIFPMVYTIMNANKLIAKQVDTGSMAYLLAAPGSRLKLAVTQLLVLLTGISTLLLAAAGTGAIAATAMFPGALDFGAYIRLNLGVLMAHLFIAGICYLASCIFNDTKRSLAVGAGVPVLCYILQMIANLGGDYEKVKFVTFFTLFSPNDILAGKNWVFTALLSLAAGAAILFGLGAFLFKNKDIPV